MLAEGISVDGDIVAGMKNKVFNIISKPEYREFKEEKEIGGETIEKTRKKVFMRIQSLESNAIFDYYPNQTSYKTMVKLFGFEMDDWKDKRIEFLVSRQNSFGTMKNILFIEFKKEL